MEVIYNKMEEQASIVDPHEVPGEQVDLNVLVQSAHAVVGSYQGGYI